MLDPVSLIFIFFSAIMVIGVLGEEFFRRTGVADTLLLLILGFLLGQVLGIVKPSQVISIVPYFSAIALVFILFDGGLHIDLVQAVKGVPRATVTAILGFILSVVFTASLSWLFLGLRLIHGMILGAVLGGSSSITVMALLSCIAVQENTRTTLLLESTLTDVLCTAGVFALLPFTTTLRFEIEPFIYSVGHSIIIGLGVGGILGVVWFLVLSRLGRSNHAYMLTLSILFILYVIARYLGGTGALSALFFGLILGNEQYMLRVFRRPPLYKSTGDSIKRFHGEISFIIRTFFFVLMGLVITITSWQVLVFGGALCVFLIIARRIAVRLAIVKSGLSEDKEAMYAMLPRGLAAAVLSMFLVSYSTEFETFPQITFIVIFGTTLIATLLLWSHHRKVDQGNRSDATALAPQNA